MQNVVLIFQQESDSWSISAKLFGGWPLHLTEFYIYPGRCWLSTLLIQHFQASTLGSWKTPRAPCWTGYWLREGSICNSLLPPPAANLRSNLLTQEQPVFLQTSACSEVWLYLQLSDCILHNFSAFRGFDLRVPEELKSKQKGLLFQSSTEKHTLR